jgi:hypothetical protein
MRKTLRYFLYWAWRIKRLRLQPRQEQPGQYAVALRNAAARTT